MVELPGDAVREGRLLDHERQRRDARGEECVDAIGLVEEAELAAAVLEAAVGIRGARIAAGLLELLRG